jgi:Cys-rich protein (TIGR01571 family)
VAFHVASNRRRIDEIASGEQKVMMQTLPILLCLLSATCCLAVRPKDVASQDHIASSVAANVSIHEKRGTSETLAVGHAAALQRDEGRRSHQNESTGHQGSSLGQVGSRLSGHSAGLASSASASKPPDQTIEATEKNVAGKEGKEVDSPQEQPRKAILDGGIDNPKYPETIQDDNGELDNSPSREGPVTELLGDKSAQGVVQDEQEVTQELDDWITDIEEVDRIVGRHIDKFLRFFSSEGYRHVILNIVIYLSAVFIAMGLYFMWFQHREISKEQDFRYGLLDCLGDSRVCLCGICCPAIRWADTMSEEKAGFLDFTSAFLLMLGLGMLVVCPYTGLMGWLAMVVVGVYFRQRIREKYNLESDTTSSYIEDFMVWCCCCFCALCQEARQVDEFEGKSDVEDLTSESAPTSEGDSRDADGVVTSPSDLKESF